MWRSSVVGDVVNTNLARQLSGGQRTGIIACGLNDQKVILQVKILLILGDEFWLLGKIVAPIEHEAFVKILKFLPLKKTPVLVRENPIKMLDLLVQRELADMPVRKKVDQEVCHLVGDGIRDPHLGGHPRAHVCQAEKDWLALGRLDS